MAAEAVLLELGKSLVFSLSAFISRKALKAVDRRVSMEDSPLLARAKALLEEDLDKISHQVASLAQSKRFATKSYLENGILYMKKSFMELETDMSVDGQIMLPPDFFKSRKFKSESLTKALEWFREAHKSATEVFGDKRNIPALQRMEAMEVLLFCQTMEHWDDPRMTTEAWAISVRHIYEDRELINTIKANLKKDSILHKPNESMRLSFGKLVALFTQLEAYVAQKEIPISVRQLLLSKIQTPDSLSPKYHYFHHPKGGAYSVLSGLGLALRIFSGGYEECAGLSDGRVALLRTSEEASELEVRATGDSRVLGAAQFRERVRALSAVDDALFLLTKDGTVLRKSADQLSLPGGALFGELIRPLRPLDLAPEAKDADAIAALNADTCVVFKKRGGRSVWLASASSDNPEPLAVPLGPLMAAVDQTELEILGVRSAGAALLLVVRAGREQVWAASIDKGGAVLEWNEVRTSGSELRKVDVVDAAWDAEGGLVILSAIRGADSEYLLSTIDRGLTRIWSEEQLTSDEKDLTAISVIPSNTICLADRNYPHTSFGH